jgi:hypothetical protein
VEGELQAASDDFGGVPKGSADGELAGAAAHAVSMILKRRRETILIIANTYRLSPPINYIILTDKRNGKSNDIPPRQILHG